MKKKLVYTFLLFMAFYSEVIGQSYIQIRHKALSEEVSTNHTYHLSGSSYTLNDRPDAFNIIFDISGDRNGGQFAIAGTTDSWWVNPGNIYYKPSAGSTWQDTGVEALKVHGGKNGGYISLVRSDDYYETMGYTADQIKFKADGATPEADITLNLTGQRFIDVAHNYDDVLYALVLDHNYEERNVGTIFKKSVSDATWISTGITNVQSLTAVPNTNRLIYATRAVSDINNIYGADNDNTNVDNYGNPIPALNIDFIEEIAFTYDQNGQPELWALSAAYIYKSKLSGSWTVEEGINDMQNLASTGGKMLMAVLIDGASENIPWRIFQRAQDGIYLDDERVRVNFNSNTVNIPVVPGTYTITQDPVAGWHITDIRVNEGTATGTTSSLTSSSATVVVSAGEVVIVEFENQLTTTTSIGQTCGTNFTEDFSSYKNGDWGSPMTGLISYHKATGNFGYGHYAIVSSTDVMKYGDHIYDHTSGDATGSMLLVDATFERGIFYRRRFTDLLAGAKYSFGAWITNFNPPAGDKPNVSFEIYNATTGALLTTVASGDVLTSKWQNFTTAFESDGEDIELVLRNNTPLTGGNDLAIDDISFGLSIPAATAAATFDCSTGSGTITVLSPVSAGGAGDFEYSIDGNTWQTGTVFAGISTGSYTLRVRYTNTPTESCGSTEQIVVVNNCLSISGNVWRDANGDVEKNAGESPVSGDNTNSNGGNSSVTGSNIFAVLAGSDGTVITSAQVTPAGTYVFNNVVAGNEYKVILSTAAIIPGTSLTVGSIPSGWLITGTNDPVNDINPTNHDAVIDLGLLSTSVDNVNFGIQTPPVADPKTYAVVNSAFSATPPATYPAKTGYQSIPASSTSLTGYPKGGSLSGSDPEDCLATGSCNTGTLSTFIIETINPNTKLYYDFGSPSSPDVREIVPGTNGEIENFDVNKLVIYAQNGSGLTGDEIGFTYSLKDKAGAISQPVPYSITTSSGPLPVNLIEFNVNKSDAGIALRWATSTEQNTKGFEIQRSGNGIQWGVIGFVASKSANGNTTSTSTYYFSDILPGNGISYYRLKITDRDGQFTYSPIRSLNLSTGPVLLYPNPATTFINVSKSDDIKSARIVNLQGKTVKEISISKNLPGISIGEIPTGIYLLQVIYRNGESYSLKFIKE